LSVGREVSVFDGASWVLLLWGTLSTPLDGSPYVVYVPGWALSRVSLPKSDFGCSLRTTDTFVDLLGTQFGADTLENIAADYHPGIIYLDIDLNSFSPRQVVSAMQRIRRGWNPKVKTIIFVRFYRAQTIIPSAKSRNAASP
jgi:hypothetical protein